MSFPFKIQFFPVFTDFNRTFLVQNTLIQGGAVYRVGAPKTQILVLNEGGGLFVMKGTVI